MRKVHQTALMLATLFASGVCGCVHAQQARQTTPSSPGNVSGSASTKAIAPGARVSVLGGGISGKVFGKTCVRNAQDVCPIQVRARYLPRDTSDLDDVNECIIRVVQAVAFERGTRGVRWNLKADAVARGFTFTGAGVAIDYDMVTGPVFEPPQIIDSGRSVRAMLRNAARGTVSSYTLYLLWTNPSNSADTFPCEGYDPVIVNQDN